MAIATVDRASDIFILCGLLIDLNNPGDFHLSPPSNFSNNVLISLHLSFLSGFLDDVGPDPVGVAFAVALAQEEEVLSVGRDNRA